MSALDRSRRWCVNIMREHAKSFYFATRLLPRNKRLAVEALYGLFRTADDTADEPGMTRVQRDAVFEEMLAAVPNLRAIAADDDAAWFEAVRWACAHYAIDVEDMLELIRGCRSDLDDPQIETLDDLYRYSRSVAGTVGRTMMPILGASDTDSLRRAERLGVAMQYTNVARDVAADRALGRNYLPYRSFPGAGTAEVVRNLCEIAREYYREAHVLAARVPNDGSRAALLIAAEIYGGILDHLQRRDYDTHGARVYVPRGEKVVRAARSLLAAYTGFATIK